MRVLMFLLVSAAFASLSCGWRDNEEDRPLYLRSAATPTVVAEGTAAPSGGAASTAQPVATPTAVPAPTTGDTVSAMLATADRLTFSVTYQFQTQGQAGTLTFAQEPPRHATIGTIQQGTVRLITDGAGTVSCWQLGQIGACSANPAPSQLLDLVLDVRTIGALAVLSADLAETAPQAIAGRTGRCFAWTHKAQPASGCLDTETGLILSVDLRAESFAATARGVTLAVDPSLFVAPFPVN